MFSSQRSSVRVVSCGHHSHRTYRPPHEVYYGMFSLTLFVLIPKESLLESAPECFISPEEILTEYIGYYFLG